jgi:ADP-heptose:LPS heptosyltransferase
MTKSSILVIHHGALGDVVATFPALLRLRKFYSSIAVICQGSIGRLARELHIVDTWFPMEAAAFATIYSSRIHPNAKNFLLSYDKIILFSSSISLEKTLSSISENEVYRIEPRPVSGQRMPVAQHLLWNLSKYGLMDDSDKDNQQVLYPFVYTDRRVSTYDPLKIIIHPGSGSPKKCWPMTNFIKIAALIGTKGWRPEFILGPAEHDLYDILMPFKKLNANIHRLENLSELAGLLKTGGGFIGNDSGVSHLAAFMGLPTVAVFGPSDPVVWKPMGRAVKVVGPGLECSPCFEAGTIGCEEMDCFNLITPELVASSLERLINI